MRLADRKFQQEASKTFNVADCIATLGNQPFALDFTIGYADASHRTDIPGFGAEQGTDANDRPG